MKTNYILIDYENVQVKSLALLKGDHFRVHAFLGPKNTKLDRDLAIPLQEMWERAKYIELDTPGPNALDFHITFYLGKLSAEDRTGSFCIISKDTGFDSLIEHAKKQGVDCSRAVSIEAMLGIKEKVTVEKVAVVKAPPSKKAKNPDKLNTNQWKEKIVVNLKKLGTGLPRTEKTLKGKIKNWCGAKYSEKEIEAVFDRLVKTGVVKVEGAKVSYALPG